MPNDPAILEFGGYRLNPGERSLANTDGTPIPLTRRLYDTLLFMVERPGRLLEKQALMDAVWKGAVVEENTLSRTVSNLRQILGERAGEHRYIETVSGLGYRFVEPVTAVKSASAATNATEHREPSIAVLPFEDLSRERDQSYFADGIAEEVLNRLASVKGLRVIAKSSAFRFRGHTDGAQAVGRALGVDYLLSGSVRKDGDQLRVTTQLVDAGTDSQRWSERFDRVIAIENLFALQDEIARAVARALSATLGIGQPSLTVRGTQDLEAYDLFLRGRALVEQGGAHGATRSVELFRAAVTRDPQFAAAWLWLASAARSQLIFAPERTPRAVADLEEAAAKVMQAAPDWWAAHLVQSWRYHLRRDWLAMDEALTKASTLAPDQPHELAFNVGILDANLNGSEAAAAHLRSAARMDPLSLLTSGLLQMQLIAGGRYEEADTEYRRSLDLPGDREMVEHLVLHSHWARGEQHTEAFHRQFRRYLDLTHTKPAPVLEDVYRVWDQPAHALDILRAAAAAPEYQNPVRQLVLSWWLAGYGDVDAAFAATWRGYVDFNFITVSWLWFPVLKQVREHARFPELLERVGLAAFWRQRGRGRAP